MVSLTKGVVRRRLGVDGRGSRARLALESPGCRGGKYDVADPHTVNAMGVPAVKGSS